MYVSSPHQKAIKKFLYREEKDLHYLPIPTIPHKL